MSVASLLNVPKTRQEWDSWAFNHKIQHDNINQAILTKKNKRLVTYVLDPINQELPDVFLNNNFQSHLDICSLLNVEGSDLLNVNWQEDSEISNWIFLHWLEHSNFNIALGI